MSTVSFSMNALKVLKVVEEGRSLKAVGGSAGSLHTIGHARWPTREHSNLRKKDVLFLQVVKELVEVWTTKVGDSSKSSEQTLARQPLKVTLADVLQKEKHIYIYNSSILHLAAFTEPANDLSPPHTTEH